MVHSEDEEEVEEIFDLQVVVSEVLEVEDVAVVVEIISPAVTTFINNNASKKLCTQFLEIEACFYRITSHFSSSTNFNFFCSTLVFVFFGLRNPRNNN